MSDEAAELCKASTIIDLHLDGFIWHRVFGYDLHKRHNGGPLGGRFGGHLDFVRAHEFGLTAGMWSITTNPFRTAAGRWRTFQSNLDGLLRLIAKQPDTANPDTANPDTASPDTAGPDIARPVGLARDFAEFTALQRTGAHIVMPAIQGGHALEGAPDGPASIRDKAITRVTLVHLNNSCYGVTSAPFALHRRGEGLTAKGKQFVEQLNAERIFVDLAHINREGFWDAVRVHDASQPLICTHTGVCGVHEHWRNLDDDQLRAIADTGGVIGIIFEPLFLSGGGEPRDGRMVIEHIRHIVDVVGEDFAAIGSDYDGMISPPKGLRHEPAYGRLIQWMLELGWSDTRIQKILGGNFLRAFEALRPQIADHATMPDATDPRPLSDHRA